MIYITVDCRAASSKPITATNLSNDWFYCFIQADSAKKLNLQKQTKQQTDLRVVKWIEYLLAGFFI